MRHTPPLWKEAAKFYESSPDGQYDQLAAQALNSHTALIDALEDTVLALTSAGQYSNWKDTMSKAEKALKLAKGEE